MGEDWSERKPDQPFFARITYGGTHRTWNRDPDRPIDINDIELPPYYPQPYGGYSQADDRSFEEEDKEEIDRGHDLC